MSPKSAFARVWPTSLASRVFLIIVAGLVVAHAASYVFFEAERARAFDRFIAADIAARIVDGVRNTPSGGVAPERDHGSPARNRVRWKDVDTIGPPPADGTPPSAGLDTELRRLLAESFDSDPVEWMVVRNPSTDRPQPAERARGGASPRAPGPGFDRVPRVIAVALALPAGRKVIVEALVMEHRRGLPAEAWTSVALIFAVTALFTWAAVRLAVQPMGMLADAADRLSRNIEEPPLPEKGAAEIRAAARAFNRMQDRLRRHVNTRSLAFAAMSHDIRTPLTRMRLRLESLGGGAKEKLEGDLDEIEALAKSVLQMTRDLAPDEAIVAVDLDALVRRLAKDYELMGSLVAVAGHCAEVKARPAALRRALGNLLDNALKYGKDASVALGDSREHALIEILDRGPGIPDDDLAKVAAPFYRVESSRNRDTGGAGLGLSIAKDIVEGQGGQLLIENRSGGGLKVTVKLPR